MSDGPSRFLFVTWEGGGNAPPEIGIARRLVARGHRVRFLCDPTLADEVRAAGCEHSSWTTAPHRNSRDRSADIIRDYEHGNVLAMMRKYMDDFIGGPAARWAGDTLAELEARPVDVMVADMYIPAVLIAAEKLGVPSVSVMPNIWVVPTPGIPPMGPGFAPARGPLGRLRDAILRALIGRAFARALPPINAARAELGLPALGDFYEQMLRADEIHVLTSPAFDFTSPAMPAKVRYTGPVLDDPTWSAPWQSPWPDDDARPLVLVALSSTFQDQVATLRRIVAALRELPVRAVVTLGCAVGADEVGGTENVRVVQSAPHAPILARASAIVTHCGHGTTLKALAAGVPLVCMPMGRDQNDTAARVVHRGAGVRLRPTAEVAKIRAAVEKVLREPRYRERARDLARAIAAGEGCIDPVDALERLAAAPPDVRRGGCPAATSPEPAGATVRA